MPATDAIAAVQEFPVEVPLPSWRARWPSATERDGKRGEERTPASGRADAAPLMVTLQGDRG